MISVNKNHSQQNREAGVSLMLAVLVLSAITAIAFSVATIVFIEIRSAGDSLRTEPALYATLGVTEEALFQYKRYPDANGKTSLNVPACTPVDRLNTGVKTEGGKAGTNRRITYGICSLNGVTLSMPGQQPIAFDNSPRVEFLGAGVTKVIPMYVAYDFDQQYESVQIDVLPNTTSSSIEVSFQVTKEDDIVPEDVPGDTVKPGTPYNYTAFTSTGQYDLILYNPSEDQDISVSITTVRVGNEEPAGLPFVGEQVLRIMADYAGLTRTYQVRIPIP